MIHEPLFTSRPHYGCNIAMCIHHLCPLTLLCSAMVCFSGVWEGDCACCFARAHISCCTHCQIANSSHAACAACFTTERDDLVCLAGGCHMNSKAGVTVTTCIITFWTDCMSIHPPPSSTCDYRSRWQVVLAAQIWGGLVGNACILALDWPSKSRF